MTIWQKFAAAFFGDCVSQGLQLDTTQEGVRACREEWLRSKALQLAEETAIANPDEPEAWLRSKIFQLADAEGKGTNQ